MSEEDKEKNRNEIIEKNQNEKKSHLLLLTLDEFINKKKLTKFTSK